jgi:methionine salvage enolase-phosphatase E1
MIQAIITDIEGTTSSLSFVATNVNALRYASRSYLLIPKRERER